MEIDVFTLFPDAFEWFGRQHHMVGALAHGHALGYVNYREHTPLRAGQVDDTPFGGGAGMVLRIDVVEAAPRFEDEREAMLERLGAGLAESEGDIFHPRIIADLSWSPERA